MTGRNYVVLKEYICENVFWFTVFGFSLTEGKVYAECPLPIKL